MISPSEFIELLNSDKYIEAIYLNGNCYKLYLLLKKLYPESELYITKEKNHIVTKINGRYYDITGDVKGVFSKVKENLLPTIEGWSFYNNNVLAICECPYCEEPIIYEERNNK